MANNRLTPSLGETGAPNSEFALVNAWLQAIGRAHPDYYDQEATQLMGAAYIPMGVKRTAFVMQSLAMAKAKLEGGQLDGAVSVNLFAGLAIRDAAQRSEFMENSRIIEDWYNHVNQDLGQGPASYYDLEEYARSLNASAQWVVESAPFRFQIPWKDMALRSASGRLIGLQRRIGQNTTVGFRIPNLGNPETIVPENAEVNLYVIPRLNIETSQ